jgi:hypothetical protein
MKTILYTFALLLLPLSGIAEENIEQKIKNILNDKSVTDPFKRWKAAFDTTDFYYNDLSHEETMRIYAQILLPFVEKEMKKNIQYHRSLAYTYRYIGYVYGDQGTASDRVQEELFYNKSVKHGELSKNDTVIAFFYYEYANMHLLKGNVAIAHDYFYKALQLYESIKQYHAISDCLYRIAESYTQIRDIAGLRAVLEQMQQNIEKKNSVITRYNLYSVQGVYYDILAQEEPENSASYNDSALCAARNIIQLIENHRGELPKCSVIAWEYYNMSITYQKCYPERLDSVYYFLDKALEGMRLQHLDVITTLEIEISVYLMYAELNFEQKKYTQAEKDMLHVLSLLEQIQDYNTVIVEYSDAYKFLAKCYETMNKPREALKYQKLLQENEAKRYNNEKVTAMNDMLVKYETEKKEGERSRLSERNRNAQKILLLAISLILFLLMALLFFIRYYRIRKKSLEQSIYESALLAELNRNELEQNLKEKEQLQKQYSKLETQANRNKEKAESYNVELTRIKQQLEQKPTQTVAAKLAEWISKSAMKRNQKETYLQQLSELDIDAMEKNFLSAHDKISNMDMKYIICFAINMKVQDMCLLFNIEPNSIYIVRYRIKKKFEKNIMFFG